MALAEIALVLVLAAVEVCSSTPQGVVGKGEVVFDTLQNVPVAAPVWVFSDEVFVLAVWVVDFAQDFFVLNRVPA